MRRSGWGLHVLIGLAVGSLFAGPADAHERRTPDVQASLDAMTRHDLCARDDEALRKLTHALGRSGSPADKPRRSRP